ncbi:MAG: hypothetical protein A2Y95_01515 [Deltaproteobacteria bacterium RBG_13_65_10]|nr:MAG: hypothetical protein A2Y95_01515 [Deltaproteobacteria bacterium RBG_13_65_10]
MTSAIPAAHLRIMDPLALQERRIAVDAMGGDHAPGEILRGVAMLEPPKEAVLRKLRATCR